MRAVQCGGSSPRIRGESFSGVCASRGVGIIPANTGRITQSHSMLQGRWDHPREYGENSPCPARTTQQRGSSPRIRGELSECGRQPFVGGIIPANTGRIESAELCDGEPWDHPREYGENPLNSLSFGRGSGSSPRIRGELTRVQSGVDSSGIIPANTGRITTEPDQQPERPDHPREYGENADGPKDWAAVAGSSPRIRGESGQPAGHGRTSGIIPANTGRILADLRKPDQQD